MSRRIVLCIACVAAIALSMASPARAYFSDSYCTSGYWIWNGYADDSGVWHSSTIPVVNIYVEGSDGTGSADNYSLAVALGTTDAAAVEAVLRVITVVNEETGAAVQLRYRGIVNSNADIVGAIVIKGNGNACEVAQAQTTVVHGSGSRANYANQAGIWFGWASPGTGGCQRITWTLGTDTRTGCDFVTSSTCDFAGTLIHELGHGVFNQGHIYDTVCSDNGELSIMRYSNSPLGRVRVLKNYDNELRQSRYGVRSQTSPVRLTDIYSNDFSGGTSWTAAAAASGQSSLGFLYRPGSMAQGVDNRYLGWVQAPAVEIAGFGATMAGYFQSGSFTNVQSISPAGFPYSGPVRNVAIAAKPGQEILVAFEPMYSYTYYTGSDTGVVCYEKSIDAAHTWSAITCSGVYAVRNGLTASYDPASNSFVISFIGNSVLGATVWTVPVTGSSTPSAITNLPITSWHAPATACNGSSGGCRLAWEDNVVSACMDWAPLTISTATGGASLGSTYTCGGGIEIWDMPALTFNATLGVFQFGIMQKNDAIYSYSLPSIGTTLTSTGDVYNSSTGYISPAAFAARTVSGVTTTEAWFLNYH